LPAEPITVVLEYQAQPGKQEVARRELAAIVATVVAQESACLGITMLEDPADPTRFLLYERWSDKAVFLGPHMNTPHLLAFVGRAKEFVSWPPQITFWREVVVPGSDKAGS